MVALRRTVVVVVATACGCARPLLGPDDGGSSSASSSSTGLASDAESSSGDAAVCHGSYVPCLPLGDDLDCTDVVAMGKAPVQVVGPDDYGLDADADGWGCEP